MTDAIDPRALRRAFGAFATGVTISTTLDAGGQPVGFTANSFSSVSLDPPLLLVCLAETASSYPAFRDAGRFAVNVLGASQRGLSTQFATRGADKFAGVAWRAVETGAPVLDGSIAWFDCRTHALVPAGDHVILIGRVVAFGAEDRPPLGYVRGGYIAFGAGGEAFNAHAGGVRVSAVVERRREALLRRDGEGLRLPSAAAFGPATNPDSLLGALAQAEIRAELPFVFASYDQGDVHHVVYRGAAPGVADPAEGWVFAPFEALPLHAMPAHEARILSLYATERAAHAYGRYVGDAVTWAGGPPPTG
ncbi:MAG: flavin reductase [Rhodobacteraceae bacterium]|nr:MAG: flavin reductase [Paracoccaceae bacterium]